MADGSIDAWMADFEGVVVRIHRRHPNWRRGQTYYHVFQTLLPEWTSLLNPAWDPYYDDSHIDSFREWLRAIVAELKFRKEEECSES